MHVPAARIGTIIAAVLGDQPVFVQEAASHVQASDKEEIRAVEDALEDAFESPRPEHESLEKLISLKVRCSWPTSATDCSHLQVGLPAVTWSHSV